MQKVLVQTVTALSLLPGAVWAQAPSDTEGYYGWKHMMGWGGGYAGRPMVRDISATPIATHPDAT
jgi:hypothetical protein